MKEEISGLNSTPSAERVHIGFFGVRNAGKSSVVNAVTGQELAIVSEKGGTTTDPVKKAMELLPLGPVVVIDTPGVDDEGALGMQRVERAKRVLNIVDIAVLVADAQKGLTDADSGLIRLFDEKNIAYIVAYNKSDLLTSLPSDGDKEIHISAKTGMGINSLKEKIAGLIPNAPERRITEGLIEMGDTAVLVTPIDSAAPKGRLILPQQQTLRDILDINAVAVVVRETQLKKALNGLKCAPKIVITDSQAFGVVHKIVPKDVPLTSFSILFARYKSDLVQLVRGAAQLEKLRDGDTILIAEGCTHHRQCDDIGTVKLPGWINKFTGRKLSFEFSSGNGFPDNLSKYALIIHCGACMLNSREVNARIRNACDAGVPITNYGVAIAMLHGILRRSLSPFPDALAALDE